MNVLHLLSWFPTPDDPTLGNFCVRMIDALPEDLATHKLVPYETPKKYFEIDIKTYIC